MKTREFWKRLWIAIFSVTNALAIPIFLYFACDTSSFDVTWYNVITLIFVGLGLPYYIYMLTFSISVCLRKRKLSTTGLLGCLEILWFSCICASLLQASWTMLGFAVANLCGWPIVMVFLDMLTPIETSSDVERNKGDEESDVELDQQCKKSNEKKDRWNQDEDDREEVILPNAPPYFEPPAPPYFEPPAPPAPPPQTIQVNLNMNMAAGQAQPQFVLNSTFGK